MVEGVNTLQRLTALVEADPGQADVWAELAMICRKVDVGRRLLHEYAPDWRQPQTPEPLSEQLWPRVLELWELLIKQARETGQPAGRRLKLINSGFRMLDLWRACGGEDGPGIARVLSEFRAELEQLVHE